MESGVKNLMDLVVWQRAMDLVPEVYKAIDLLPSTERYAMADQLRRASVSVPANIAEGHDRHHSKEFVQHLGVAKGSLAEIETLLLIAQRLGYLKAETVLPIREQIGALRRPLFGLVEKIRQKNSTRALRPGRAKSIKTLRVDLSH
jgi:four helix bundle protein